MGDGGEGARDIQSSTIWQPYSHKSKFHNIYTDID